MKVFLTLFSKEYNIKANESDLVLKNRVISEVSKGKSIIYLSLLETLSTSKPLLKKSSTAEKKAMVKTLGNGLKHKLKEADYFSGSGFSTIESSMDILESELSTSTDLQPLSTTVSSDTRTTVFTPMGSAVAAWNMVESSASTRAAFDAQYTNSYPNAQKIITYDGYSSTRRFNCHGYAWHRSDRKNDPAEDVWIGYSASENDPEHTYIRDGSYIKQSQNVPNARIVWASGDHTAVNVDNTWCISKWNEWPLMKHKISYSPFGSANLEYYTKKPVDLSGVRMVGGAETASYSVNYVPYYSSLEWHYDTNLLTLVSSSSKGIVLKPKTSTTTGDASVQARFLDINGDVNSIYKDVGINGPHYKDVQLSVRKSSDGSEAYPSGGLCPNSYYYAYLTVNGTYLTNVDWGASKELSVSSASNTQLYFGTSSAGWGILNITATTSYGVRKNILGVTLFGGGSNCSNSYYSIYVSPSSDILNINFDMNEFNSQINERAFSNPVSFDIRLYNITTGSLVKQVNTSGYNVQLDISDVPNGIYIVHVYDGISKTPQTQKISIKH